MKKIGFIDLFIDEWHANNYPKWFSESSFGNEYSVAMAWEERPSPTGRNLFDWCKQMAITPASGIEDLVDKCDAICILAPANPEVHEHLAKIPLRSGKPVYIDKPFAQNKAAAERIFNLASKHNTPLMSSSALRFGTELLDAKKNWKSEPIDFVSTRGGGTSFAEYGVHQIEMIVSLMGTGAKRIMQCGNSSVDLLIIDFGDGRKASLELNDQFPFSVFAAKSAETIQLHTLSDIFPNLIDAIGNFFSTRKSPIAPAQTIEISSILCAGIQALQQNGEWIHI